ncbi:MAG: mechanosensitive ion channel family protein, partial [Actinomycetota bacterium]|nr:mechanosensitive ion channel family protein [Actinomycetota bacterium]
MPFAATTPAPSPPVLPERLPCWRDGENGTLCDWVYDRTHLPWLAEGSNWLIAKPIRILLIVLLAVVARAVLHRLIARLARRAAEGTLPGVLARGAAHSFFEDSPLLSERRKQRADT